MFKRIIYNFCNSFLYWISTFTIVAIFSLVVVHDSAQAKHLDQYTWTQYVPYTRVWYDESGNIEICPEGNQVGTDEEKFCWPNGLVTDNHQSGWVKAFDYNPGGYTLQKVDINETGHGPSLVFHWLPTSESLKHK